MEIWVEMEGSEWTPLEILTDDSNRGKSGDPKKSRILCQEFGPQLLAVQR